MSTRDRITLLLVTRRRIARASVNRSTGAAEIQSAPCPDDDELPALVDAAARLGTGLGGRVWLLTDDLFSQTFSLAPGAIRDLNDEALGKALGFEAQALSGMPATDSIVAWRPLPADSGAREFWVSQMLTRERDHVDAVVRERGGRLAGILHPAGVPAWLSSPAINGHGWRRIEHWRDATVTVESKPAADAKNGSVATHPVRIRIGRAGNSDFARLRHDAASVSQFTEQLVASDARASARMELEAAHVHPLDDEAALARWLVAWLEELRSERASAGPVIQPAPRPLPAPVQVSLTAIALLVVLGLATYHYAGLRERRAALEAEVTRASAPRAELSRTVAGIETREREVAALRAAAVLAEDRAECLSRYRQLPARQLDAIAASCPPGVVVESIDLTLESTAIHGLCIEPQLADRLANDLATYLRGDGYTVSAPIKRKAIRAPATSGAATSGAYEFDLDLVPPVQHAAPVARPGTEVIRE